MDVEVKLESLSLNDLILKSDLKIFRANISSEQAHRMEKDLLEKPSLDYFFESEEVLSLASF
jgi:hypothetical protein